MRTTFHTKQSYADLFRQYIIHLTPNGDLSNVILGGKDANVTTPGGWMSMGGIACKQGKSSWN